MIAPSDQVGQEVALLTLPTQAKGTEEGAGDEHGSCVLHDARRRCQLNLTRLGLPKNVTTCVAPAVAEVCLSADSGSTSLRMSAPGIFSIQMRYRGEGLRNRFPSCRGLFDVDQHTKAHLVTPRLWQKNL